MASLKSKLERSIRTGKINVFFLFAAISFVILLLTKLSKDYTKTITFNVKVVNLPEEQVIIKDSTHQLNITLTTYGFKILRYYVSNPYLALDMNLSNSKGKRYTWIAQENLSQINSQFLDNVKIESIKPDTLLFNYDVNFVKKVPVVLSEDVTFAPGFNLLSDFNLEPDSIRLIGPKVLLSEINTITTDSLILSDVKSDIEATVNIVMPEQVETIMVSSRQVNVFGEVDKFTEGEVQVPVEIINVPSRISVNYFPKKVTVLYNVALSNYNKVNAKDFVVQCDFKDLVSNDAAFLTPTIIKKPEIVKSAKVNQSRIEFILSQ